VASLVLGLVGTSVLAVIFGHVARRSIRRSYGRETGAGMALAGLILGYIEIVAIAAVIVFALVVYSTYSHQADRKSLESDVRNAVVAVEQCYVTGPGEYPPSAVIEYDTASMDCFGTPIPISLSLPGETLSYVNTGDDSYAIQADAGGHSATYASGSGTVSSR
jgi:hypothetical protein